MAKANNKKAGGAEEQVDKVRTSMYINPELLKKIQFISFMDDGYESQTQFITDALNEAVGKWEKKHGEAVKK